MLHNTPTISTDNDTYNTMADVASQIGDVDFAAAGEGVAARLAQEGLGGRVYDLPEFSDISDYSDDGYSDAQEQWEESLRQLEQLVSFVLIPLIGKFFGRRAAFYGEYIRRGKEHGNINTNPQCGDWRWTGRRPRSSMSQTARPSTSVAFWGLSPYDRPLILYHTIVIMHSACGSLFKT